MAQFRLHRSNDLTFLATLLSGRLSADPISDPMRPECIIIGHRGIEDWLTRTITQAVGVGANLNFPFRTATITSCIKALHGLVNQKSGADIDPWSPDTMTWSIAELLLESIDRPEFSALKLVLDTPSSEQSSDIDHRLLDLARHIAAVFDRYLMYRPDWTLAWGQGRLAPRLELPADHAWQPILWRALDERYGHASQHLAKLLAELPPDAVAALRPESFVAQTQLQRLSVFGLTSIPRTQLHALGTIAQIIDVDLYALSPSDTYWADIRSAQSIRDEYREDYDAYTNAWLQESHGVHPLLSSLGRSSRDFQHLILDHLDYGLEDVTREDGFGHHPNHNQSVLEHLQADLQGALMPATKHAIEDGDRSVQIHSCHGPARQVDALRDTVLHLLNDDPSLEPRDIIIMCPDLEFYAPLLTAAFDDGSHYWTPESRWGASGVPRLEYRFADLSMRRLNPIAEALLQLLDLAESRLPVEDVMKFLELECVQRRFDFKAQELSDIETLCQTSQIRWGIDAHHRRNEGQPETDAYTWLQGLKRIALGAAMSDQGQSFSTGDTQWVPHDDIEADKFELAGRLLHFATHLFAAIESFSTPCPLPEWTARLDQAIDWLTEASEQAQFLKRRCRDVLNAIRASFDESGSPPHTLSLEGLKTCLKGQFDMAQSVSRSSLHALQCSNFQSLRGIPARVVMFLGMDDNAYPHASAHSTLDLTLSPRWIGDSDSRDEQRGALLDAIFAARDALVVFYTGRDTKNHEPLEPASPIRELMDALDATFEHPREGTSPSAYLTRQHTLHRFAAEEYQHERPWSFSELGLHASRIYQSTNFEPLPTVSLSRESASNTGTISNSVSPDDMRRWLLKPQRMYAREIVQLNPAEPTKGSSPREPLEVPRLQGCLLNQSVLDTITSNASSNDEAQLNDAELRSRIEIPIGTPGQSTLEVVKEHAQRAHQRYLQLTKDCERVDCDADTWTMETPETVHHLDYGAMTLFRNAETLRRVGLHANFENESYRLEIWIDALLATIASQGKLTDHRSLNLSHTFDGYSEYVVTLPGEDEETRLSYATAKLNELLSLSTKATEEPLMLFRRTSYNAIEGLVTTATSEGDLPMDTWSFDDFSPDARASALNAAKRAWGSLSDPPERPGECQDEVLKALYRGSLPFIKSDQTDSFDDRFIQTSIAVWLPVCLHVAKEDTAL